MTANKEQWGSVSYSSASGVGQAFVLRRLIGRVALSFTAKIKTVRCDTNYQLS